MRVSPNGNGSKEEQTHQVSVTYEGDTDSFSTLMAVGFQGERLMVAVYGEPLEFNQVLNALDGITHAVIHRMAEQNGIDPSDLWTTFLTQADLTLEAIGEGDADSQDGADSHA